MTPDWLQTVYINNTVKDYLIVLGILLVGMIIVKVIAALILKKLRKFSEVTKTTFDDFLSKQLIKVGLPLAEFAVLFFSISRLNFDPQIQKLINLGGIAFLTFFVARFVVASLYYGIDVYFRKNEIDDITKKSFSGLFKFGQIVVYGIALVFFLDNLGINISALMAGMGIGGIAVAFAAQSVLKDLFCYFSIIVDRPFVVGDFIIVNDLMGTVADIGILTTRVTSLGGEQLIFANTDLVNSRVRNYKRMQKRRIVFQLGVTYQTSYEEVKAIPGYIKEIVKSVEGTVFDRSHFATYGDSSLKFETVYYVDSGDYNKYMDIQEEINLKIMEKFKERGIEFAYPTQTLFLEKSS